MHKLYLTAFMDMCNGEILRFGIAKQPTAKNVVEALEQVIERTSFLSQNLSFRSRMDLPDEELLASD